MKSILLDGGRSSAVSDFALRNYKTYVAHYKSRKLIPMPLDEFLKNYAL